MIENWEIVAQLKNASARVLLRISFAKWRWWEIINGQVCWQRIWALVFRVSCCFCWEWTHGEGSKSGGGGRSRSNSSTSSTSRSLPASFDSQIVNIFSTKGSNSLIQNIEIVENDSAHRRSSVAAAATSTRGMTKIACSVLSIDKYYRERKNFSLLSKGVACYDERVG